MDMSIDWFQCCKRRRSGREQQEDTRARVLHPALKVLCSATELGNRAAEDYFLCLYLFTMERGVGF